MSEALGPVEVLRRIAYLLEGERADSYRVRAFRRAADTLAATDANRLRSLAAARRLTDLAGVGGTSAGIVAEVLAGRTPAYLTELEARRQVPADPAVAALCRTLVGDLHTHSDWSDGANSIADMAAAAAALGHRYVALTDHSPRLTVAHGLDADRLRRQLDVVAALNERVAPFRVLTGIEVDILADGSLDQDDELLGCLDIVVASVHSTLRMEAGAMTARMVTAVENPHTDILGHCTGRLLSGRGRPASTFDAVRVFEACARAGTAVEINSRPERRDPPPDLLVLAVEAGCMVSIDTDAHAPGELEWQHYGCEQAVAAAVPADRVANSWPLARLLAWAGRHEQGGG